MIQRIHAGDQSLSLGLVNLAQVVECAVADPPETKSFRLLSSQILTFVTLQETYERERMEHGRTLERLDAYKTKQQQQQMMQQQDQQQIRDLHKESLDQILSLEERIRQLELQEFQEKPAATTTTTTTTTKTTMPTTKISLTDQHKSGTKDNKAMKSIGDLKKRGDEVRERKNHCFAVWHCRNAFSFRGI